MELVKHKFSGRVYVVMRDHNPEKPYLTCPEEHIGRTISEGRLNQFFVPTKDRYTPVDKSPVKEIEWENKKLGITTPQKSLEAHSGKKERAPSIIIKPLKQPIEAHSGPTTLKDICQGMGIDTSMARKILRSQIKKPQAGWVWDSEKEVLEVKKILKKSL